MATAYIETLKRQMAAAAAATPPSTLRDRFLRWYGALPPVSRDRPFAMSELEAALGTQGRHISPILVAEGWRRARSWQGQHYFRYWRPPGGGKTPKWPSEHWLG